MGPCDHGTTWPWARGTWDHRRMRPRGHGAVERWGYGVMGLVVMTTRIYIAIPISLQMYLRCSNLLKIFGPNLILELRN